MLMLGWINNWFVYCLLVKLDTLSLTHFHQQMQGAVAENPALFSNVCSSPM